MKRYIYVLFMFITLNLWACSDSEPSTDGGGEEVVDKTTDCQSANEKELIRLGINRQTAG